MALDDSSNEDCRCIESNGLAPVMRNGKQYIVYRTDDGGNLYPTDYGTRECRAWDELLPPSCADTQGHVLPEAPAWCRSKWCYVNPACNRTHEDVKPSRYFVEYYGEKNVLWYSYNLCGDIDIFTENFKTGRGRIVNLHACLSCQLEEGYQDERGATACKLCPANSYRPKASNFTEITNCVCKPGHFVPEGSASYECAPCPVGAVCLGTTDGRGRPDGFPWLPAAPFAKATWWGLSHDRSEFIECPYPKRCSGGDLSAVRRCSADADGTACQHCRPGFYHFFGDCKECNGSWAGFWNLSQFVMLGAVWIILNFNIRV